MSRAALLPPARRAASGLLALALACAWLVAASLPAAAAQDWGVTSPRAGEKLTGASFTTEAHVTTLVEQPVEAVRSRFRPADQPVGEVRNLERQGESQDANLPGQTRTTWQGPVTLSGLPNGTYVLEVSVVNTLYPDGSPWRGHEVVVDVPPTARLETVRVTDAEARKVEVRWVRSSAADHVRYVVQRAAGGGRFSDVHSVSPAESTVHVDTVPEHGDYRYRIQVVRLAADGSERTAVSDARSVSVRSDASGRPESGEEPDGPLGDRSPVPDEEVAAPPPSSSGTTTPRLSTRSPAASQPAPGGRGQRPTVTPPPNPNTTFEERLDYGVPIPEPEPEPEADVLAEAGGSSDAGTLTVFGGESSNAEQALKPVAGGLVLTLFGLHIVRFLRTES